MQATVVIFIAFAALLTYVPATAMILGGRAATRRASVAGLVPIEAVVVSYANWTTPTRVTFDYPAPDGSWIRATRVEGFSSVPRPNGWFVHPGDRFTVYVDPQRPLDVRLSPSGSAAGFGGGALTVVGAVWAAVGTLALIGFALVTA